MDYFCSAFSLCFEIPLCRVELKVCVGEDQPVEASYKLFGGDHEDSKQKLRPKLLDLDLDENEKFVPVPKPTIVTIKKGNRTRYYFVAQQSNSTKDEHYGIGENNFWTTGICPIPDVFDGNIIYKDLFNKGLVQKTKELHISKFGSTCEIKETMPDDMILDTVIPRPFPTSVPGGRGQVELKETYMMELAQAAQKILLNHLFDRDFALMEKITTFQHDCHDALLIGDTFFTGLTLIGDMAGKSNSVYYHNDDHAYCSICIILESANCKKTGITMYQSKSEDSRMEKSIDFQNGRYHIGPYNPSMKVFYRWNGQKAIIKFDVEKKVVDHVDTFGTLHIENQLRQMTENRDTHQSRRDRDKKKGRQGYFSQKNFPKQTGTKRSCLQDAVVNAAKQLGVDLNVEQFMEECPPKTYTDTQIAAVFSNVQGKLKFVFDFKLFRKAGGPEANLVATQDRKVRLVCSDITSKDGTTKHSFIHCAYKLRQIQRKHVGAMIDNRSNEPIWLLEESDGENIEVARTALQNFFGGEGTIVKFTHIYEVTKPE